MKSFAEIDIENGGNYIKLLSAVSKISGLFSDSSVPYINYRVAENIFCRSFNADNLSRSDTAFDANYNSFGVGLKTFICNNDNSTEKVAEFNSLSRVLSEFKGKELAFKLGKFRNDRINFCLLRRRKICRLYMSQFNIIGQRGCYFLCVLYYMRFTGIMQTFNTVFLTVDELFYQHTSFLCVLKRLLYGKFYFIEIGTVNHSPAS